MGMFATGCVVFEVFIYFELSSIYYSCNLGEKGYWKPVIEIPLELCIINKKILSALIVYMHTRTLLSI